MLFAYVQDNYQGLRDNHSVIHWVMIAMCPDTFFFFQNSKNRPKDQPTPIIDAIDIRSMVMFQHQSAHGLINIAAVEWRCIAKEIKSQ